MPVTPTLILASQSPRRASLLRDAGYVFEQMSPPYDDPPQPQAVERFDSQTLATELASRKAMSLFDALVKEWPTHLVAPADVILIGADTICIGVDGSLIGQPTDAAHARAMICSFTNATHDVVTGVTLLRLAVSEGDNTSGPNVDLAQMARFADVAPVTFGDLSVGTLDAYLATDEWRGKAGGYNLFDRQADGWPITLPSSDETSVNTPADPTTVVGLPMRKLQPMLAAWGVQPAS